MSAITEKWNALRILIQWLEQGRTLELDDITYGISKEGNIIQLVSEDSAVELPTDNL